MKLALLFPGQGSQYLGMLDDLAENNKIVRETFEEASAVIGEDLWQLVTVGPKEQLDKTEFTQPCMLAADIAVLRAIQNKISIEPTYLTGHSLGEYAALVASGCISFADAIYLVSTRGKLMQKHSPEGVGAMAALIGLENNIISEICFDSSSDKYKVEVANFNCPKQVVISGHAQAVDLAMEKAKVAQGKAIKLNLSVPSHCFLMKPAAEEFGLALKKIKFKPNKFPVIHNATSSISTTDKIGKLLQEQLYSPVNWVKCIEYMKQIDLYLEIGPNKVLTGLQLKINRRANIVPVNSSDNLTKAITKLQDAPN